VGGVLDVEQAGGGALQTGWENEKRQSKSRKKTAREEVEPSWGFIAEPLSKNGTIS